MRSPVITRNAGLRRLVVVMANSKLTISCSKLASLVNIQTCGSYIWMKFWTARVAAKAKAKRIGFIGPSGFQVVGGGHRAGAGLVLAGAGQFGDLADVAEVVERPFIQHLRHGELAILLMQGEAIARPGGAGAGGPHCVRHW